MRRHIIVSYELLLVYVYRTTKYKNSSVLFRALYVEWEFPICFYLIKNRSEITRILHKEGLFHGCKVHKKQLLG